MGYALETLSQLVLSDGGVYSSGSPTYWIPNTPWAITDTPRFGYRGLMVDTARHFLPLNALRRQIDGLSFNKMNALHWHLTDAQSTPLASKAFPNLQLGAFHPNAVYTLDDIKGIVEYARLRGVQILLEIDMPGHSFAFGVGYPELILNCSSMYPLETEFWTSSLDITRGEQLYSWLETLLTELTAVLPNTLFHIGGDEVQYQCWSSSDVMVAYLKSRNITAVQLYVASHLLAFPPPSSYRSVPAQPAQKPLSIPEHRPIVQILDRWTVGVAVVALLIACAPISGTTSLNRG